MAPSEISTSYPDSRYLIARGYGNSKTSAQFRAKSELANIFESKINSELKLETRAVSDSIKGEYSTETIDSFINIYSHVTLKGVQVKDIKSDEGQYTALAILDKIQAQDNWLNEIFILDQKIDTEFQTIQKQKSKLHWIKHVQTIWHCWLERTSIVSRLSVIGSKTPAEKIRLKNILELIAIIKNNIKLFISISGNYGKIISDNIAKTLNNEGFVISDNLQKADVFISGHLSVEPLEMINEEWKFSRASVSLHIIDCATNNQVYNITENIRRGHLTTKESIHKSINAISIIVQKRLLSMFDPLKDNK